MTAEPGNGSDPFYGTAPHGTARPTARTPEVVAQGFRPADLRGKAEGPRTTQARDGDIPAPWRRSGAFEAREPGQQALGPDAGKPHHQLQPLTLALDSQNRPDPELGMAHAHAQTRAGV